MDVQIREATEADMEPLIVLSRRTISATYRAFLGDKAVDAFIDSGAIEAYTQDTPAQCSVIFVDATHAYQPGRLGNVVLYGEYHLDRDLVHQQALVARRPSGENAADAPADITF